MGQTYDAQVLDNEFWGAVGQAEAGSAVLLGSLQRGYANIGLSNFKLFGEVPKTTIELLFESPGRYHSWISVDAMPSVDKFHFGANAQNAEAFIDFTKGAKSVGNKAKYIGPGLSLMEAYNTQADPTSDTGDKFRDWGKFAVDSTVLGLEFVSTKFTPWGWGYTIADFSVSFMDYTPTYGTEAGIPKSSWTALWYWNADAQYVANQQRFEMVKKFPTMTGRRW